jgi:hypothetical protein
MSFELPGQSCRLYLIHVELKITRSKLTNIIGRWNKPTKRTGNVTHHITYAIGKVPGKPGFRIAHAQIASSSRHRAVPRNIWTRGLTTIQKNLDTLDGSKKFDGDVITCFALDKKRFKFRGEFNLPLDVSLAATKPALVGTDKVELTGLQLRFRDSRIGLRAAELAIYEDMLWLELSTDFYASRTQGLITETFAQARRIGALFVEEA